MVVDSVKLRMDFETSFVKDNILASAIKIVEEDIKETLEIHDGWTQACPDGIEVVEVVSSYLGPKVQ